MAERLWVYIVDDGRDGVKQFDKTARYDTNEEKNPAPIFTHK
jgi:hypothetical protein